MPKGIFRKLWGTYTLIFTIIILLLALSLAQYMKVYFFRAKQDFLLSAGRQVNTLLIKYHRKDLTKADLTKAINIIGKTANARVIIIEAGNTTTDQILKQELGVKEEKALASLQRIMQGQVVIRKQYAPKFNSYVLAVGLPVQAGRQKGAVVLFSPVYEVNQALAKVYKLIGSIALTAFLIGTGIIYLVSRRLSRPIIQVSKRAEELAQGKVVADISLESDDEVGELVASFNYMKNQLERTEKMRKEFIAGVSHELRTPLTGIRGFIQAMLDGVIPQSEFKKYLTLTFEETGRLTRLTNDLLELAKLESGGVSLQKSKFDLTQLVQDTIDALVGEAEAKGVGIKFIGELSPLEVLADKDKIKQVLWNVLSNSLKYTLSGGKVEVAMKSDFGKVLVQVNDTGVGIPEGELPYIFDKFYRVEKSRDVAMGGTGLGLAITKELIELHQGQIEINSKVNQGTQVMITLPK